MYDTERAAILELLNGRDGTFIARELRATRDDQRQLRYAMNNSRAYDVARRAMNPYRADYPWGDWRDAEQAAVNSTLDAIRDAILAA